MTLNDYIVRVPIREFNLKNAHSILLESEEFVVTYDVDSLRGKTGKLWKKLVKPGDIIKFMYDFERGETFITINDFVLTYFTLVSKSSMGYTTKITPDEISDYNSFLSQNSFSIYVEPDLFREFSRYDISKIDCYQGKVHLSVFAIKKQPLKSLKDVCKLR